MKAAFIARKPAESELKNGLPKRNGLPVAWRPTPKHLLRENSVMASAGVSECFQRKNPAPKPAGRTVIESLAYWPRHFISKMDVVRKASLCRVSFVSRGRRCRPFANFGGYDFARRSIFFAQRIACTDFQRRLRSLKWFRSASDDAASPFALPSGRRSAIAMAFFPVHFVSAHARQAARSSSADAPVAESSIITF